MEKRFYRLIVRWFWLLILMPLVAAGVTYHIISRQPVLYETTTRLIVGPGIDNPSPELNDLRAGAQLMETYAELPQTHPFLTRIIEQLDLDLTPARLSNMISVVTNEETQILDVTVTGQDPIQITRIANAVATELVLFSPSGGVTPAARLKAQIGNQATVLEASVAEIEANINALTASLEATTEEQARRELVNTLTAERSRLADIHRTLATLYQNIQEATTNEMRIIEPAVEAKSVDSELWVQVMTAAAAGLGLSLMVVAAFEYRSNAVETVEDLARVGDAPVLGAIARYSLARDDNALVVRARPDSRVVQNFRAVGARLLFSNKIERPARSVLILSVTNDEEAGPVAANLAVILAQTGQRILLVDADLHRPVIAGFFHTPRTYGLTSILNSPDAPVRPFPVEWVPGLSVLPSGPITADAFSLLASLRMLQLLRDFEQDFDLVLITAPSLPAYADSFFLGSQVDRVMVVARHGQTRRDAVQKAVESLRTVGAEILGLVLTHSPDAPGQEPRPSRFRRFRKDQWAVAPDVEPAAEPAVPL
ncbi:MAG: hypothetical protein L0332_12835 [Chloroflexi bacterium]|nr:hypothetical protein [Chloroflexota bacterium]MCI0574977.1 hypothetical protein [Chloroflexota bacterium]MCI0648441.1 hypothetical protein [Chloroflexota bacterium]MCI0727591.1 hypothetical protein [Chloroflexota bacterium]